MGKLFEELKRRKVFRVAAVYAVVAWVLIQVADTIAPLMNLPESAPRLVLFLLIILFPVAVFLAWAFEVTPEGINPDSSPKSVTTTTTGTDRKLIYATFILVLLVAGFQIADRFLFDSLLVQSNNVTALPDTQVRRSVLPLGSMAVPNVGNLSTRTTLRLSPNGSRLAYVEFTNRNMQLYIREMDQLSSRPIESALDDNPVTSLTFSPDGESLAYFDGPDLMKVSVVGGGAQTIAANLAPDLAARSAGIDWGEDNTIVFTNSIDFTLSRVSATTGVVQTMEIESTPPSTVEQGQFGPQVLPGGAIIFARRTSVTASSIELFDGENSTTTTIIQNGRNPSYTTAGFITFIRDGSLWAVPFDIDSQQTAGDEVMLIENIETPAFAANYTLSDNGDLIYLEGTTITTGYPASVLSWVDRSGDETIISMEPIAFGAPELSPDDSRIAMVLRDSEGSPDIWSYELARGTLSRLTFNERANSPLWSPDGGRIFYSSPSGPKSINTSGVGQTEQLVNTTAISMPGVFQPTAITPDATDVLGYSGPGNRRSIYRVTSTPEQTSIIPLMDSPDYMETAPAISPNGRWLAYVSDETGRDEVYVRPYPDINAGKWQISTSGGFSPRWAAGTGELFYRNRPDNDGHVATYAVAIEDSDQFNAGIPELLFSSAHYALASNSYMVSSDGQRFLMMRPASETTSGGGVILDTNLILVENFAGELRRRVPVGLE